MNRLANENMHDESVEEIVQDTDQVPEAEDKETGGEPIVEETSAAEEKSEADLLNEKVCNLNDKLLRTMAEYDNFRKRSQREKESIYPQATANAVSQFLPVIDNVERALAMECADVEFKKGVEMILHSFMETLTKLGVEAYGAPNDAFDPDLHNAVMHIDDDALEANVLVEVFQKGYKLGDRIIRHAMVKVAN